MTKKKRNSDNQYTNSKTGICLGCIFFSKCSCLFDVWFTFFTILFKIKIVDEVCDDVCFVYIGISLQTYTLESFGVELKLHWVVETSRALVFHYDAPRIRRSLAHLIQTLHHHHHHLHPLALYSPLDKTTTKTSTYLQALAFTESFVRAAVTSIALLKMELHWFLHDSLIVLRHLHHHLNDYTTALVLL